MFLFFNFSMLRNVALKNWQTVLEQQNNANQNRRPVFILVPFAEVPTGWEGMANEE